LLLKKNKRVICCHIKAVKKACVPADIVEETRLNALDGALLTKLSLDGGSGEVIDGVTSVVADMMNSNLFSKCCFSVSW
jgi:hypothetical protein